MKKVISIDYLQKIYGRIVQLMWDYETLIRLYSKLLAFLLCFRALLTILLQFSTRQVKSKQSTVIFHMTDIRTCIFP